MARGLINKTPLTGRIGKAHNGPPWAARAGILRPMASAAEVTVWRMSLVSRSDDDPAPMLANVTVWLALTRGATLPGENPCPLIFRRPLGGVRFRMADPASPRGARTAEISMPGKDC